MTDDELVKIVALVIADAYAPAVDRKAPCSIYMSEKAATDALAVARREIERDLLQEQYDWAFHRPDINYLGSVILRDLENIAKERGITLNEPTKTGERG